MKDGDKREREKRRGREEEKSTKFGNKSTHMIAEADGQSTSCNSQFVVFKTIHTLK